MKECASEVLSDSLSIFCMKSCIKEHRNHKLCSSADLARTGLNWLCCLTDGFYALESIPLQNFSECLKHTLVPSEDLVNVFFQFCLKFSQRTVCFVMGQGKDEVKVNNRVSSSLFICFKV